MASSDLNQLRDIARAQQGAFNGAIGSITANRLAKNFLATRQAAQAGTKQFQTILKRADAAVARIKVRSFDIMTLQDAGKADAVTIDGIGWMLNHGDGQKNGFDAAVRVCAARRDLSGLRYLLGFLPFYDTDDINTQAHRSLIDDTIRRLLTPEQVAALNEEKEASMNMPYVQRNHDAALAYFEAANDPAFLAGLNSVPVSFTDWAQLDETGANPSYPGTNSSILKLSNGMEQFQRNFVTPETFALQ